MAFSPWHGLAAHRPIGGVMRSRKPAYEMSSGFKGQFNGCPIHEPRSLAHCLSEEDPAVSQKVTPAINAILV